MVVCRSAARAGEAGGRAASDQGGGAEVPDDVPEPAAQARSRAGSRTTYNVHLALWRTPCALRYCRRAPARQHAGQLPNESPAGSCARALILPSLRTGPALLASWPLPFHSTHFRLPPRPRAAVHTVRTQTLCHGQALPLLGQLLTSPSFIVHTCALPLCPMHTLPTPVPFLSPSDWRPSALLAMRPSAPTASPAARISCSLPSDLVPAPCTAVPGTWPSGGAGQQWREEAGRSAHHQYPQFAVSVPLPGLSVPSVRCPYPCLDHQYPLLPGVWAVRAVRAGTRR